MNIYADTRRKKAEEEEDEGRCWKTEMTRNVICDAMTQSAS